MLQSTSRRTTCFAFACQTVARAFWICVAVAAVASAKPSQGAAPASLDEHVLWTVRWNRAGTQFAVGGRQTLQVFDATTLESTSLLSLRRNAPAHAGRAPYLAVTRAAWHPSKSLLAVSSQGANVSGIYDVDAGKCTALTHQAMHYGRGVSWSPEGNRLAFTSDDRLIICEADGSHVVEIPRYAQAKGLSGVAWSPLGNRIVTIGGRITLHTAQGKPIKQIMHRPEAKLREQLLLSVAWHPSGSFFAVGDYGTEEDDPVLQFWTAEGDLLKHIALSGDTQVRDLSWNSDGGRLASASGKLRIWTKTGELDVEAEAP
ncbi:MAG: WD40 repeat domain-containing protein, partial [Planctomycetales bacterium]|nr:WD40 repeat domain-containing protein [Planctomycetales bacterium]